MFQLVLMCSLLAGCVVLGPDYQEPASSHAGDWLSTTDPRVAGEAPVGPKWWEVVFQDPELNRLIEIAMEQNLTLRSAGLRVLQSQQQLSIAVGNQYPQQQQISGAAARQKANQEIVNNYNVGFNLSWELDFWGRFRRQVESASAELDASVADYDGVMVSLVAQVAQSYILIKTFRQRVNLAQVNVALQEESLRVAQAKLDVGDVSELDVDQAETLLYNTRGTVASLEISLQQLKNTLANLLGRPPHNLNYLIDEGGEIPSAAPEFAVGMPQDVIRRRPDLRAAERRLAAQSERIGVAQSELYPSFTIGGSIGSGASESGDLFQSESEVWNVFGGFEWNIFNYGRLKSNVRLQDARFQQQLVEYHDSVIRAQGEVENAIVAFLKSHEQLAAYRVAADSSTSAVTISNSQYENGLIDYNRVLTTLSTNVQQQDQLATTQGSVATNMVAVYRSLGGGWEIRAGRDPVELLPSSTREQMRDRTSAWGDTLP
jgi:NodT family efflux transporter outer membrane factor (OMF) lipoprotein